MTARTPGGGLALPGGSAGATVRSAIAAALERVRAWRAGRILPAPARLWEAAVDGTSTFRPGSRGLVLTCRAGTFLVTQAGDPLDHVLEPGGRFRTTARGRVAAWALQPGALEIGGSLGGASSAPPRIPRASSEKGET